MSTPNMLQNIRMSKVTYGTWLKEQRAGLRMSQEVLEQRANLSARHVSKYENGKLNIPTDDVRMRIHEALGTSEEDLVDIGLLRRVEYRGNVYYNPIRDEGRASQDAPPIPGTLPLADVVSAFRDAARDYVWTPAMVRGVIGNVHSLGSIQQEVDDARISGKDEPGE